MTRQPPYECPHGRVLDWGDYGPARSERNPIYDRDDITWRDTPEGCLECMELKEQAPLPISCGPQFGATIARHLGLDPAKVRNIRLDIAPGGVATATVEHIILHPDETEPIEAVFKDYTVLERAHVEEVAKETITQAMRNFSGRLLEELRIRRGGVGSD